jgi:hypothetical protein
MRRVADAFYGRQETYRSALGNEETLAEALARNVYEQNPSAGVRELARYVNDAAEGLARQPISDIAAGRVAWPAVAAISKPRKES